MSNQKEGCCMGLILFVLVLGAFLGALSYAIWCDYLAPPTVSRPFVVEKVEYLQARYSNHNKTVITTKKGARLVLNGFHSIPSNGTKLVWCRREGHHWLERWKEPK